MKICLMLWIISFLLTYIKILSPIVPFITDKIYQNLVVSIDENAPKSIHLTDFPKYKVKFKNDELIEEVDAVKQIVNLGRSSRNKVNIKIRQPLENIKVFISNDYINRLRKYDKDAYHIENIVLKRGYRDYATASLFLFNQ